MVPTDPKGREVLGLNYATAPLRNPLKTGADLEIECQPKGALSDWPQIPRAWITVEARAAILAIGTGPGRIDRGASTDALLMFNDDSAQSEWWKD